MKPLRLLRKGARQHVGVQVDGVKTQIVEPRGERL